MGQSFDPGQASHVALREVRRTLEKHPAVTHARGFPPEIHNTVVAEFDPTIWAADAENPTIEITWYDGDTADEKPRITAHYSDASGFDCGVRHESNPHVDGWAHYQERSGKSEEYVYTSIELATLEPGPLVWEIMEIITDRVANR